MRWLDDIIDSMHMTVNKLQETVKEKIAWELVMDREAGCCGLWGHKELDTTERLN